jgi:hypothetical protein
MGNWGMGKISGYPHLLVELNTVDARIKCKGDY